MDRDFVALKRIMMITAIWRHPHWNGYR